MGRYRTINVDLNRQYRNDLNKNFEDIEKDIFGTKSDIARVEAESKERDNLIAGTDVDVILQRIDSSADNADVQAQHAKTQGDYAKSQGDYAKSQGDYANTKGDYANEKAILADQAAANANTESSNLSQLKIDVTTATQNANTATGNANAATTNANNAATYATTQGDYAKREADRVASMDVTSLQQQVTQHSNKNSIDAHATMSSCRLYHNTNQSVGNGVLNTITFNSKRFDTDNMHTVANRIIINTAGKYLLIANVRFAANVNGVRSINFRLNNSISIAESSAFPNSNEPLYVNLSTIYEFKVGDYVQLVAYQNSGTALDVTYVGEDNQKGTELMAVKVG